MSADPRVDAIRRSPVFGVGTCSVVDECYEDSELIEDLDDAGAVTVKAALEWAAFRHAVWADRFAEQQAFLDSEREW